MATINGFDGVDDNISSGGIPSWDTLFSSTYGGDDVVSIFSPHYDVHLGEGRDSLSGGIGGFAYGEGGNDNLTALLWQGDHNHYGGDDHDTLGLFYGGDGATYTGSGGDGQDLFLDYTIGARGSHSFDGGAGFDIVLHFGVPDLIMSSGSASTKGQSTNSYAGIEGLISNAGNDVLIGTARDNLLVGGGGNDSITGGTGDDFLVGEGRSDNFARAYLGTNINFSPADALDPLNVNVAGTYAFDTGGLNDSLYGGGGNDVLCGGDGADLLNGGIGEDWASYLSSPETAALALGLVTGGTLGQALGDSFISIENVQGSNGHDTIEGSDTANILLGLMGNDSLSGLLGSDTLNGGTGRDTLAGGRGSDALTGGDTEDVFVFAGIGSLTTFDTITDMQVNFDEIWLSAALFRKAGSVGALSAEKFHLGSAAHDRDDRLIYDAATGALFYDADGNRAGQTAVQIAQLATGLALTEGDFVVIA